jgi:hypothetical protein
MGELIYLILHAIKIRKIILQPNFRLNKNDCFYNFIKKY